MPVCCVALHLLSLRSCKKVGLIPKASRALSPEPFTALSTKLETRKSSYNNFSKSS